ncbi:MAG: iron-containing alcohol dehydrogenase [Chloroflexi bacterium]|nr:iron-containing alcohol dehydrogenase [Chloroflexota bacterium]
MTELTTPSGDFRCLPVDCVSYGAGSIARLMPELQRLGCRRAFVITGHSLATQTDLVAKLGALLGECHAGTYARAGQHVPSERVIEAAAAARAVDADCLISFGGGSPNDTAKMVAYCLADGIRDANTLVQRGHQPSLTAPPQALLPLIAISTTLSAGEFNPSAGVTDERTGVKGRYAMPGLAAKVVILDPEQTIATPDHLWGATGIKALDHAIERIYAPNHQPLTDACCVAAIQHLLTYLPGSLPAGPETVASRGQCQIGAWLSVFGMNNVRTGLSHALGHQIGAGCNVPHGVTSCVTLPHVILFMGSRVSDRMAIIGKAMDLEGSPGSVADRVADRVAGLVAKLGLPSRLRDVGVPEAALERVARATATELNVWPGSDPLLTLDDARALLRRAW